MKKDKDNNVLEQAYSIRNKLIDAHTCFIHSIYSNPNLGSSTQLREVLIKDLENVCKFIEGTTMEHANPTVVSTIYSRITFATACSC